MSDAPEWPERIADEAALEDLMTAPDDALRQSLARVDGDIVVLGVGGKMGPTLAGLAKRAAPERRVVGVARFSDPRVRDKLAAWGVEAIQCDLLDRDAVAALPRLPNVVFMAGRKFGAVGDDDLTWAMNAYVPAIVAETFHESRIVAFSTGCVYPFVDVRYQGADRRDAADAAARGVRQLLRRPRAADPVFLAAPRHAGLPGAAQLRDRHALRRAA